MGELVAYNLSPQQQRFWTLREHTDQLCAQIMLLVTGTPNEMVLHQALQQLIDREVIFRTTYQYSNGVGALVQVVNGEASLEIARTRINSTDELEPVMEQARRRFDDLKRALTIHALFASLPDERLVLILTVPSICADLWSLGLLAARIAEHYAVVAEGKPAPESITLPYLQFAEWQNQLAIASEAVEGRRYWQTRRITTAEMPTLPLEQVPSEGESFAPAFFPLRLSLPSAEKIREALSGIECTTEEFLSLCWQVVLWSLVAKQPLVVGHVNTFRDFEELSDTVGLLCRCLPMATPLNRTATFRESLRVHQRLWEENEEHKAFYFPDEVLPKECVNASLPYAFEFVNGTSRYEAADVAFTILFRHSLSETSKLKLTVIAQDDGFDCTLQYDAQRFSRDAVDFMAHAFRAVVEQCEDDLDVTLDDLSLLDDYYTDKILHTFAGTAEPFVDGDKTVVRLFEEQVARYPNRTAVICGNQRLTYRELNERANALAAHLRAKWHVSPGDRIGLMCGESERLIIGMLGIVISGAAYVPIDPHNPKERISFILRDSGVKGIVAESQHQSGLSEYQGQTVWLDADETIWQPAAEQLPSRAPEDVVYAIYTSGTTGQPKGILIRDKSLVNYVCWLRTAFSLTADDSSILLSSYAFDLGYTSLWGTLLSGATLHLVHDSLMRDPETLVTYLTEQRISFIKTTPTLFHLLVHAANANTLSEGNLRLVLLGGEQIRVKNLERFARLRPGATIINHYGPTESTIGVVAHRVDLTRLAEYSANPVIGKPIANTAAYILDDHQRLVGPGLDGGLCVAGAGLAQGYLNREDLTEEKFIDNPFVPGTKIYRTGDRARWLADGAILYLGREDDQVKIRGYRVELREVQHALLQHRQIDNAAVVVRESEDFGQELAAYFTSSTEPKVDELRGFLAARLPEYMLPSYWMQLDSLPLTANGKLDQKALPDARRAAGSASHEYVAPQDDIERELVTLWEQVLGHEHIGTHDNFFELGGHSLKAIQLVSRLRESFNVDIPVSALFEVPVIADLALVILQKMMERHSVEKQDQILAGLDV